VGLEDALRLLESRVGRNSVTRGDRLDAELLAEQVLDGVGAPVHGVPHWSYVKIA
jgi:hypothetical protein